MEAAQEAAPAAGLARLGLAAARAGALASPQAVLALQRCAGNQAVAGLLARAPAAIPEAPDRAEAGEVAQELKAALEAEEPGRVLAALRGHDVRMRGAIQDALGGTAALKSALRSALSGDDLVRAWALLRYEQLEGPLAGVVAGLGLALIPRGTRDDELFRLLESLSGAKQTVIDEYATTFGDLGEGSLRADIIDDLSGWAEQKALTLLERELTPADHLYFVSVAIAGTRADTVVKTIQDAWKNGTLPELDRQWNTHVKNRRTDDVLWTDQGMRAAIESELSGEALELVSGIFDAYVCSVAQPAGKAGPEAEAKAGAAAFTPEEKVRLDVAEKALASATTGGFTGLGTNVEQLHAAVVDIRTVWEKRLERARKAGAEDEVRMLWEKQRDELEAVLADETSGADKQRGMLMLAGELTDADQLWLAWRDTDGAAAVEVVTAAWQHGDSGKIAEDAAKPRTDGKKTLRGPFDPKFAVVPTASLAWWRVYKLLEGPDEAARGAARLALELSQGSSDTQLEAAFTLLRGAKPALREATVAAYGAAHADEPEGDPGEAFLASVSKTFGRSPHYWKLADLLDPARDHSTKSDRGRGGHDAAHSGIANWVLDAGVAISDAITAEDVADVEEQSLRQLEHISGVLTANQRLGQMAARTQAATEEIEQMARLLGKQPDDLGSMAYEDFKTRLDELRSLQKSVADAMADAVELAVSAAITAATGGAAAGALLGALASKLASIGTKELLLGEQYETFSKENAEALAAAAVSSALGKLGGGFVTDIAGGEEALKALGRSGAFWSSAAETAGEAVGEGLVAQAFSDRMPSAEEIVAKAADFGVKVVTSGASGAATVDADLLPLAAKLRQQVVVAAASDFAGSVTGTLTQGLQKGLGDDTGVEIVTRWTASATKSATGALARGLITATLKKDEPVAEAAEQEAPITEQTAAAEAGDGDSSPQEAEAAAGPEEEKKKKKKVPRQELDEPFDPKKRRPDIRGIADFHEPDRHGGIRNDPEATVSVFYDPVSPDLEATHAAATTLEGSAANRRSGYAYEDVIAQDTGTVQLDEEGKPALNKRTGKPKKLRTSHDTGDKKRHGDVWDREVTVRSIETAKLDQIWRDLVHQGSSVVIIPRLSDQDAKALAQTAAAFEKLTGRKAHIAVRETLPPEKPYKSGGQ